jgi:hypothetical protein
MREAFESILKIGRYWSGAGVIELIDPTTGKFWANRSSDRMWGRIILRSAMAKGGLESTTAAAAWLDEAGQDAFTQQTWEAILRRLSLYQGRVLITTTLYQNHGWLKTLNDMWLAGDKDIDVIQFDSTQNPAFSTEELERAKRTMQGWRFDLFYRGRFSVPPGQIYRLPNEQIVKPFVIPQHWPRHVGVDFGAINTALVWSAHDERADKHYIYRTSLHGNQTTQQHCTDALAYVQDTYPNGEVVIKENVAAWWGGAPSETQQRMDWTNAGVPVLRPPVADVEAGIDRVTQLINTKKLFVFNDDEPLLNEFNTYSREMDDNGHVFESIRNKNEYHRLDATRYLCAGIYGAQVMEAPSIWS